MIIVGAPRSGTNMLRNMLTSIEGFATWPCDEINPIWRHGNLNIAHDELRPENASPRVKKYLRKKFRKLARTQGAHTVVEKTCATSLRVGFAAEVFPEAKFIFIRRDGVDAAPSAMKRWNAPFDFSYTLRKLRWVPPADIPRHFSSFACRAIQQRFAGQKGKDEAELKVATWWGPRPRDFRTLQREHSLDEVATIQWQRCVEASLRDFGSLPDSQVLEVVYEDFVRDPVDGMAVVLKFLGCSDRINPAVLETVLKDSVGKGRATLGPEASQKLDSLARSTLKKLGYA